MVKMPLFPLNTVLFPGTPIFLHIFEERYKLMVGRCIEREEPFGVIMIEDGCEVGSGHVTPVQIGCSARIVQVEELQDGRMNLIAIGCERFEIVSTDQTEPYLQGNVIPVPMMQIASHMAIHKLSRRLRPHITQYLDVLHGIIEIEFDQEDLPDDPLSLGYMAAWILKISAAQKQTLLSLDDATTFLETLRELYRLEIAVVRVMIEQARTDAEHNPNGLFSLN